MGDKAQPRIKDQLHRKKGYETQAGRKAGRGKNVRGSRDVSCTPTFPSMVALCDYGGIYEQPYHTDEETEAQKDKCLCEPGDTSELDPGVSSLKVGAGVVPGALRAGLGRGAPV